MRLTGRGRTSSRTLPASLPGFLSNLSEDGRSIDPFTPVERREAAINFGTELIKLSGEGLVVIFQKSKSFPHHFAGRVVSARLHFRLDEIFKLGGERDVHGTSTLAAGFMSVLITNLVKV